MFLHKNTGISSASAVFLNELQVPGVPKKKSASSIQSMNWLLSDAYTGGSLTSRFSTIFLRKWAEHRVQKVAKGCKNFSSGEDDTDSEISMDSDRDAEFRTSDAKSDTDDEHDDTENIPTDTEGISNVTEFEIIAETLTWDDISGVSGIEYLTRKLSTKLFLLMILVNKFSSVIMNNLLELQR